MEGFLDKLASAFATAEGYFVHGSLPNTDDNPGDLRTAPWVVHPDIEKGFWHPLTLQEGIAGLYHTLALDIARGMTLRELVYKYAPPTDGNNTANYLNETARRLNFTPEDVTRPLWNWLNLTYIK